MDRNVLNFDLFVLNCCFFLADYDQLEFSISSSILRRLYNVTVKILSFSLYICGMSHYAFETRLRCIAYLRV